MALLCATSGSAVEFCPKPGTIDRRTVERAGCHKDQKGEAGAEGPQQVTDSGTSSRLVKRGFLLTVELEQPDNSAECQNYEHPGPSNREVTDGAFRPLTNALNKGRNWKHRHSLRGLGPEHWCTQRALIAPAEMAKVDGFDLVESPLMQCLADLLVCEMLVIDPQCGGDDIFGIDWAYPGKERKGREAHCNPPLWAKYSIS